MEKLLKQYMKTLSLTNGLEPRWAKSSMINKATSKSRPASIKECGKFTFGKSW